MHEIHKSDVHEVKSQKLNHITLPSLTGFTISKAMEAKSVRLEALILIEREGKTLLM